MAPGYFTIDLKTRAKNIGDVSSGEGIEFLSIDVSEDPKTFLALVHFSVHGVESEAGLRIDLGNGAFLDYAYGALGRPKSFSAKQMKFLFKSAPLLAAFVTNQDLSL